MSDISNDRITSVGYQRYIGKSDVFAKIDHQHDVEVEDWKYLENLYQNDWVDYDTDGAEDIEKGKYLLLPTGFVIAQGTIKDGDDTDGTILWNFPVGYRPKYQLSFVGNGGTTSFARFDIKKTGDVVGAVGLNSIDTSFFFMFEADRDTFVQNRS